MYKISIKYSFFVRLILLVIFCLLIFYFISIKYWYSVSFFTLLTVVAIVEFVFYIKKYFSYNNKIIEALLHDDYSLNLETNEGGKNNQLKNLYKKIKEEKQTSFSKEILYQQLLNSVSSGFLILRKEQADRKIIFMNKHFQDIFEIPKSSTWNKMQKFIPEFCATLENKKFNEFKTTIEIQINEEERQTYVLQNSKTLIEGMEYDVIFLDSVQRIVETTEKAAWMNIMKVIAHEIINSLTPIYSLANTTKMYFESEDFTNEDKEDIRLSLDTIMNRSKHLQIFIEKYRQLTMLPTPVKSNLNLKEILLEIESTFKQEFLEKNIEFKIDISPDIIVFVDRVQIEQVFINLIKNSIYSVENAKKKLITISCNKTENRLKIFITDSGELIDKTIISKIFLPFYTTRKNGAGIGLTLSKNIIEAHNGYLYLKQTNGIKVFAIVLVNE